MIYYICDRTDKDKSLGNHCLTYCIHGKPHAADGCTKDAKCNIECAEKIGECYYLEGDKSCRRSRIVKCRPATKRELKKYKLV